MQTQNFYPQDISLSKQKTAQMSAAGSFELFRSGAFGFLLLFLFSVLAGCGTGGYVGGGISSLSASAVTIDSGQGFSVSSTVSGGLPVSWGLACSTSSCGTISQNTGASTVYTSPSGLSAQLKVTLTASVAGTQSKQTVSITVNPDPVISGTPPAGVVGTPYTATLVASGGTGTLKLSQASGSLPAGLTFNAATGVISGTPTTTGTSTFIAQVTDSSDVPLTVTASETIVITTTSTAAQLSLSGTPPAGTVGSAYATTLIGAGGTAPYSFSVLSGSLPAGLSLSASTGAITGIPTVAGTSSFTAQVQDASGLKATAIFSIPIANAGGTISLTTSMLPNGTVGVPYSATIGVTGGTAPYTCAFTAGTLPAGLSLNGCVVSGTPTAAGTASLTVKATDSGNPSATTSGPETITISSAATLTIGSPAGGTVGVPYTGVIPITGGTAPYSCMLTSGTLPAGLTLSGCTVTGTPITAGTATVTIKATDSGNPPTVTSGPVTITIAPAPLAITTGTLPNGTVGVVYSSTIGVSGGASPYTCTVTGGTLPAGLTLGANCLVSGTPTTAGTSPLTVMATDSSNPTLSTTGPVSITIVAAPALIITSPPGGMVGTPYTGSVPVSGGTAPYTCSVSSGTLPAGLSFGSGCAITGTPITAGTSTLTVKVTDSKSPVTTSTGTITVVISPSALTITTGTLPNGTVGVTYSSTIGVTGGTSPYACTITSGTLPAGLTLGANCLVSGTPTVATTANLTVKATDSSNPTVTTTGPVSITINPAIVLTLGNPPPGTVGQPYTGTIPVTGGTGPYTCSVTNGTLPQGLSLSGCTISGTPVIGVVDPVTISVTDSGKPPSTGTGPVTITINNAPLAITTGTLPNGTVGVTYSSTIGVTGGTSPYACTITSGTLPAGLTLGANCLVSGTPTVATTANLTVKATDSSNPTVTTTGPVSITINPAPLAITTGTLPNGTVGVTYSSTIGVTGGTSPYACIITSGTLPAGLTLGANCLVSGIPTVATTANLTVKATDSSNPAVTTTGPVSITINPAPLAITTGTLPNGTVGVTYSSTIGVTGGTSPYACTITSGTLPAGLNLGANCLVSGTPTVATTANLTVKATDSSNPTLTTTGPVTITINPAIVFTLGNPPPGTVGQPYTGTIPVTGGTGPYTCAVTSGALPQGLSLSGCTISGTPVVGTIDTVTVMVTDSGKPPSTGTGPVTITINNATPTLTLGNPPVATVGTPYTGIIPVSGGTGPYTCTLNSGTVPAGLTLNNCTLTGTPTVAVTSTLNITATDASNPTGTVTSPVVVTVNPVPALTFTGSLPNGVVGVPYTQTLAATGGIAPYTYAVTAGTLNPGLSLNATTGVISGTPTTPGAMSFTVTATDSENPNKTANLPLVLLITYPVTVTDSELKGPYAFLFQGYDDVAVGLFAYQTATAGSFTADGAGALTNGELDANHQIYQGANPASTTITSNLFLGTYTLGTDNRGSLTITTLNADGTTARTYTYAIAVKAPVAPATTTAQASMIEFDGDQVAGTKGSGSILQQTAASFSTGLTGSYAFGLGGDTPCLPTCTIGIVAGPVASVGQFTVSAGAVSGFSDANIANIKYTNQPLSGSYGAADGNGRVQLSLATAGTPTGIYPTDYAVYMVDANHAFVLSTDKHSAAILLAGTAQSQTLATYANTSLNGPFIGYENAATNPGLVGATLANTINLSTATIFRATSDGAGTCAVTNVDTGGVTQLVNGLTGLGSGAPTINALLGTYQSTGAAACSIGGNGRGILNYPVPSTVLTGTLGLLGITAVPPPARIVYLASPDRGYFLETGYAGLGQIEPQTGAPFTQGVGIFNGTYIYGEAPASSAATINASGFITANGNGTATSDQDLNVGVGTVNILQLGILHNDTYTAPDQTSGRFLLNDTTVVDQSAVYVISPGRFVLLDLNPATTSPSVNVLY